MADIHTEFDDGGLANGLQQAVLNLRHELRRAMEDVATDAELIFAAHAPHGATGKLSQGIRHITVGSTINVTARAESAAGYDYVGVTRFGHRKEWIVPTHAPKADRFFPNTARAFPLPFGFRSSISGFAALSTPFGFRRRVRGYQPTSDWVADALPEINQEAQSRLAAFGHQFVVRIS